ncbi:MAG: type II secretion system protein [Thermoanaerobaculia bacterium]
MKKQPSKQCARSLGLASDQGFSMVEVLIASALFLVISLSVAPLFTHATVRNAAGADSTILTNFTKTQIEQYFQEAFDNPALVLGPGASQLLRTEYWDEANQIFVTATPPVGSRTRYTRVTRVRYCSVTDLDDDGQCNADPPLTGDSDPALIHVKEIQVTLASSAANLLGGRRLQVTTFKPF